MDSLRTHNRKPSERWNFQVSRTAILGERPRGAKPLASGRRWSEFGTARLHLLPRLRRSRAEFVVAIYAVLAMLADGLQAGTAARAEAEAVRPRPRIATVAVRGLRKMK